MININLKRIIDDFGNNNINEETQNNLKKYYNSLDENGEVNIVYKQNNDIGRYYSVINLDYKICLMKLDHQLFIKTV